MAGMSSLGADRLEVDEEGRSSSELSAGMGSVGVRLPASSKSSFLGLSWLLLSDCLLCPCLAGTES